MVISDSMRISTTVKGWWTVVLDMVIYTNYFSFGIIPIEEKKKFI